MWIIRSGGLITATTTSTVPGDVAPDDAVLDVTYKERVVTRVDDRVEVSTNDIVAVTIYADVTGTSHVHGYDLFLDVAANEAATIRFDATIPGIFEVDVEETGTRLFERQVRRPC